MNVWCMILTVSRIHESIQMNSNRTDDNKRNDFLIRAQSLRVVSRIASCSDMPCRRVHHVWLTLEPSPDRCRHWHQSQLPLYFLRWFSCWIFHLACNPWKEARDWFFQAVGTNGMKCSLDEGSSEDAGERGTYRDRRSVLEKWEHSTKTHVRCSLCRIEQI